MILIGLGANLPTETYGPPRATLGAALTLLQQRGVTVRNRAPWYESAPVPISDQPWYVNGVCEVLTDRSARDLVQVLLETELQIGRVRTVQNAPRIIDLDLLAYHQQIRRGDDRKDLSVPHPRMYRRAFVMLPLRDIQPGWRDPVSGRSVDEFICNLPDDQTARKMVDAPGVFGTEWKNS